MSFKIDELKNILCCPICKADINLVESMCSKCSKEYRIDDEVPVFVDTFCPTKIVVENSNDKKLFKRILEKIFSTIPKHTIWTDDTVFNFMNDLSIKNTVLNLGSGSGLFDSEIRVPMINLDIIKNKRTDVVADAHHLPFKDNAFDCIFSNAVLEHVKRPWEVAKEMERVVKTGGYIVVNLPFLNTIHDKEDYFRFTLKGINELFQKCKQIHGGVSSGAGSFLPLCTIQYLNLFVPFKYLRTLTYFIFGHIFFRLKVLDKLVCHKNDYYITANSFYYIGKKEL